MVTTHQHIPPVAVLADVLLQDLNGVARRLMALQVASHQLTDLLFTHNGM